MYSAIASPLGRQRGAVIADIDPDLGINPMPEEAIIACHVTDGTTVSYIGVEASGWDILIEFPVWSSRTPSSGQRDSGPCRGVGRDVQLVGYVRST